MASLQFALEYAPKYNFIVGGDYIFLHLDRGDISTHLDYAYRGQVFSDAVDVSEALADN